MQKIRGNKWNRRICKWIASLLTVALLVNQSSLSVLAEEISEEVCQCDTRCSADSVNEGCPVCAQDYGRCEGAEDVSDTDTGEETENPGTGEGVDTGTGEETENPDAGTDTDTDEEIEDSDADESDIDADTEIVSDVDAEDEEDALLQEEVARNVAEENVVSPASVGETFTVGDLTYEIINEDENDRQVKVTYVNQSASGALEIPPTVTYNINNNQYKVVSIGENAFFLRTGVTSVIIPEGVTSIEESAFAGCKGMTSITIPNSVTSIGKSAFSNCESLTSVIIPEGVTSIEDRTFDLCYDLKSIIIPNSVTSIGEYAFNICHSLTSITIPEGVTSIGNFAFTMCSSATSISIPNSVTSIGVGAFGNCESLTSIIIPNSVTNMQGGLFNYCTGLTSITILNNYIGVSEFEGCSSLTSITIPNNVTTIESGAFSKCKNLTSVTILNDKISIEFKAFEDCANLNSLQIAITENSIGVPTMGSLSWFTGCPDDRYLTFLTEDGTTELSDATTPKLSEAVEAYDAADGIDDDMWYGWKLTKAAYPVTINVNKDDKEWINSGKQFALSSDNGINYITDFNAVPNGTYIIYEKTGGTARAIYLNTGIIVKVEGAAAKADVDYYTVTFHYGNDAYDEEVVRKNTVLRAPSANPTKDGYIFEGWVTSEDGSTAFVFGGKITAKTDIYAKWVISPVTDYPVTIKVNIDDSPWSDSGKTFALSSDNGSTFITDLTNNVPAGTYTIYETTGATSSAAYVDTRVIVEVTDSDVEATVNYYTVTFYDNDTPLGESQIVLNNTTVSAPTATPTKDGYTFYRWVTSKGGSEEFDFNNTHITAKTDIYASWIKAEEKTFTITASAGTGGSVSPNGAVTVNSGADQKFTITPQEGYRVSSVLVDGVEQLNSAQASDHSRAGITDAGNGVIHYDFENVTSNHTLTAAFAATSTGGGGSGDTGDDDPDDNNGGGGSGGGGSTGGGGSGGGGDTGGGSGGGDTGGGAGGSDGGDTGGGSDNSGGDSAGSSSPAGSGKSTPTALSDTSVKNGTNVISVSNTAPASKDSEPKTGDASHMEIYATLAMIAGLSYLLLYFADGKNGMTEEEKKEIVAALVTWAKNGSRIKKYAALAVIFLILVYYHSIGKRTTVDWKEVYEK